ncbi:hypothetical protein Tco_0879348 [Tanacetum coccineum]
MGWSWKRTWVKCLTSIPPKMARNTRINSLLFFLSYDNAFCLAQKTKFKVKIGLFTEEESRMMEQYKGTTFRELNPHLFAAADDSCRFVINQNRQRFTGFVVLHYSNSKGKAYGPLPDPPSDGNDNSYAVNQAMSIRYREIKKPNKLTKSPYGIDTPSHRPNGRFSNGLNIPDIISEHLGSEPVLRYLSPVLTDKNLPLGVNFASVGIGILNATRFQFLMRLQNLCTTLKMHNVLFTIWAAEMKRYTKAFNDTWATDILALQ